MASSRVSEGAPKRKAVPPPKYDRTRLPDVARGTVNATFRVSRSTNETIGALAELFGATKTRTADAAVRVAARHEDELRAEIAGIHITRTASIDISRGAAPRCAGRNPRAQTSSGRR